MYTITEYSIKLSHLCFPQSNIQMNGRVGPVVARSISDREVPGSNRTLA